MEKETDFEKVFEEVKQRSISELFDFLIIRSKSKKGIEEWKATRTLAELGLAIFDFAEYMKGENDATS